MESKLSQSRWTALFWIFPVLFLIDDVLGLNGYQFTVHGIGIRILLFCLSAASLGLYWRLGDCPLAYDNLPPEDGAAFFLGLLAHARLVCAGISGAQRCLGDGDSRACARQYDLRRQGFYNAAGAGVYSLCVFLIRGPAAGEKAPALALPAAGAAGRVAQCDVHRRDALARAFMPSIMT